MRCTEHFRLSVDVSTIRPHVSVNAQLMTTIANWHAYSTVRLSVIVGESDTISMSIIHVHVQCSMLWS